MPYRHLIRGILRLAERAQAQAKQVFREALREEEGLKGHSYDFKRRVLLAYTLLLRGRFEDREMEVLLVIAEGLPNRDIAKRLFVGEATVRLTAAHHAETRRQNANRPWRARELMLL